MMSQMHQLSACPGCEEPLESGDRFCGACGYDLSAVPPPPRDRPTVVMGSPVGGATRPGERAPQQPVRFDEPAGDFQLPAPAPEPGALWQIGRAHV